MTDRAFYSRILDTEFTGNDDEYMVRIDFALLHGTKDTNKVMVTVDTLYTPGTMTPNDLAAAILMNLIRLAKEQQYEIDPGNTLVPVFAIL